ncbi:MAG: peptide ABC transporter ATPase [Planctomycetes bacterium DG_20]|nr:MAG: peptide ABC transporter ATPase [Planctomycetes bacterium DG_20]
MDPLLTIRDLRTYFFLDEGTVRAVDGVDLVVPRGTTVGLVGESGCGKSVTAYSVLRLISPPGRIVSGAIVLHDSGGEDVVLTSLAQEGRAIRRIRGHRIAMIFQEPMTSLSPVHTVGGQIGEAVRLHTDRSRADARAHAIRMMAHVGIPDAARRYRQYPHEMSGGLRQRAMIAMALACRPALLIADEPTTALDVTIQAQILDLMRGLQAESGMSILLITHDLGVVAEMASHVAVMYMGRVVEQADTDSVFHDPLHPYTAALLKSIPGAGGAAKGRLQVIAGSVPDAFERIAGCAFHPRCPLAEPGLCDRGDEKPPLVELKRRHHSACLVRQREFGKRD